MRLLFFLISLTLCTTCFSQNLSSGLAHYFPFDGNLQDKVTLQTARLRGFDTTVMLTAADRENNPTCSFAVGPNRNWLSIPFVHLLPPGQDSVFSISLWIYIPKGTKGGIIGKETLYGIEYGSLLTYHHEIGMMWNKAILKFPTDRWVHVVGTYAKGSSKCYVNDTLKSSNYNRIIQNPDRFGIQNLKVLDDIRIYQRELSREEITALFNSPSSCSKITDLEVATQENSVPIHPNPSNEGFFHLNPAKNYLLAEIYNMEGKLISVQNAPRTLAVSEKGVYYVKLYTELQVEQHKLLVL